ncbi:spike protein [Bat coronavirus]|uniref:Spike glycoprotein n=1 Tax=Eidolon helvum bat coronavirus CMR704-P12 TaxID=2849735 RepID=A0A2Z4EVK1_9BETC|nr:spike protein [Bat coronavirus]AWV67040.1 spike protein [Eidolon helvum bat coronavirus CMR704-P12]
MVVLLFVMFSLVVADRPNCYLPQYSYTISPATITNTSYFNVNPISIVVPEFSVARTNLVVRQRLQVAAYDFTKIPITPPHRSIFNNTYFRVGDGILVNTHMYHRTNIATNLGSSFYGCQEPFGAAFGNTFVNEPITLVMFYAGNVGSWSSLVTQQQANITIVSCDNATLCANPFFLRWGPGVIRSFTISNAFQCHGNYTFYDTKLVNFTVSTARYNLAFTFADGDIFMYYAALGDSLNLPTAYPLQPYLRIPAGFKPDVVQFFQAITRPNGESAEVACASSTVSWYVSRLYYKELLVGYDSYSSIVNVSFCSSDAESELQCLLGTFAPANGVYSLSNFRSSPTDNVRITNSASSCSVPYSVLSRPPLPFVWKRYAISNCKFDFQALLSHLPTFQLRCFGISPTKLATMCFGTVTLDIMLVNVTHYNNLLNDVPDDFSLYNYQLPRNFYGCLHSYYLPNDTAFSYTVASRIRYPSWVHSITPGGRQPVGPFLDSLQSSSKPCTGSCLGLAVISLSIASANKLVCPVGNDTDIVPDTCVNYNIYGYQGTGVISRSNYTLPSSKVFSLSSSGELTVFAVGSSFYQLSPCAFAPISAAFYKGYTTSLLFNNLPCSNRHRAVVEPVSAYWRRSVADNNTFDTTAGCIFNAYNLTSIVVNQCDLPIGDSYCLQPSLIKGFEATLSLVTYNPLADSLTPITPVYQVSVPTNFTLVASTEYIQTYASKISIDCAKYLCGDSSQCRTVLLQYGTFCNDVNVALTRVFTLLDNSLVDTFSSLKSTAPVQLAYTGDFNFTSLVGCIGTDCDSKSHRSALSDLLFSKVSVADPGFMQSYQQCLDAQWGGNIRDLLCTQTFNGISVLPPIVSPSMQALYTTALVGGIAASGFTFGVSSAAVIPFATQLQFRLNGLGVTTNVLMENQQLIANAFNKALVSIQEGFTATNQALNKIQTVVNNNALQLQVLVQQLGNTFGAISASVNEIFSRLDLLEANAEVDRLISGRMVVLNTYVTQLLIQASELRSQAELAKQKMSECVKSQSLRNDFCGNGTHVLSIPQLAPNGMLFIHYSYQPTKYAQVYTTAGLCFNGTGFVPRDGLFVRENNESQVWYFTKASFYNPVNLSYENTHLLDTCGVNYTTVNNSVLNPIEPPNYNFQEEFDKYFKNQSSQFNITFDSSQFNVSIVNLNEQMAALDSVVKSLNESFIDLKKLGVYTQQPNTPWYAWLGMIAGLVGLALAVFMLCCMTNCCSGFRGICSCKQCQYDDYADVYPAVRVSGKRTV